MSVVAVPLPCVRCGAHDRIPTLYVCRGCRNDPARLDEQSEAAELERGYLEQRQYLIARFHWVGGWSRRV